MSVRYRIRRAFNFVLEKFDISLQRKSYIQRLIDNEKFIDEFGLLQYLKLPESKIYLENLRFSKSQFKQDLFVLNELGFKKDGFFVEFGACDGISMSNTYLLEKKFNWNGILSEPAKKFHTSLKKNRTSSIEKKCVWKKSNIDLDFNETEIGGLSTLKSFTENDFHSILRKKGVHYKVKTISLEDLLLKHNAPYEVDYLSIDTEGSEYEILKNFDFNKFIFKVITVEHNFTHNREKILNLLTKKGYKRKFTNISHVDDWYIKV